jgi:hypothetical protein
VPPVSERADGKSFYKLVSVICQPDLAIVRWCFSVVAASTSWSVQAAEDKVEVVLGRWCVGGHHPVERARHVIMKRFLVQ